MPATNLQKQALENVKIDIDETARRFVRRVNELQSDRRDLLAHFDPDPIAALVARIGDIMDALSEAADELETAAELFEVELPGTPE